jgi:hypothetical protein
VSYDLFFRPGKDPVSADAIRRWFEGRRHYTISGDQIWYDNPVSGVYFSFHVGDDTASLLAFNLNYYRPEVFAAEAEPELSALVAAFQFAIDDPQADGMDRGPYTPEGFLRGWRTGNLMAHRALVSQGDQPAFALPLATNLGVWRWNTMREAYMQRLGTVEMATCFVPTVYLLVPPEEEGDGGPVQTAAVWSEQMQLALPEVDLVLALDEPGQPPTTIPFELLRPTLDRFERRPADHRFGIDGTTHTTGLAHWLVDFEDRPPADLSEVLTTAGRIRRFQRVASGQVLDRETLEAARARAMQVRPLVGES